ncbi:hypothetical protein Dda_0441 [Drechslerella dactyloides]|uniref:Uncharacterized protein n=1 Tax=Drechslerella dactyloides TaxID=74499 RepID=A0AAD6NLZ3_DREDA|nr:hypothetical protein Dda_0441 [Drechslerella dactyloides]
MRRKSKSGTTTKESPRCRDPNGETLWAAFPKAAFPTSLQRISTNTTTAIVMPARRCRGLLSAAALAALCARSEAQAASSQTRTLSVTLTAAGPLGTFNPPGDCSTFSAYSTQTLVFGVGDENPRSFTLTSLRQGCQVGGPHTSCCPPNYELGQYNSPGVCPGGYTTHSDLEFVAVARRTEGFRIVYAPIGTKTGKLCCPRQVNAMLVLHVSNRMRRVDDSIKYTADGAIPLCLATTKGPTITQGGSVVNQESDYFASAVIVVPPGASDPPLSTEMQTVASSPSGQPSRQNPTVSSQERPAASTSASTSDPQSPNSTGDGNGGSNNSGRGLSGGAIAGIAVGVAVPIIAVGLYLAYRFGKRSNGGSQMSDRRGAPTLDGAKEPGIYEQPQIGGIQ